MTELQEKQLRLLKETVEYFNINNRGINSYGLCSYEAGCAIGRKIPKELAIELDNSTHLHGTSVGEEEVFDVLPLELKELGQRFLGSIQSLHDDEENWDNKGLSLKGLNECSRILSSYNLHN